ncbi:hemagglutinin, partial [Escherichia coli]
MNLRKKHICIAISLVLNPASISQVYAQADTNTLTVEVDEAAPGSDVHGDDWKSIEIGTTQFAAKDVSKGINFDHKSPVAEGRNSIAIGTSALAGDKMKDMKTGEAISIGAKANAAREQSLAIGADTKATGWGAIVIGGDDLTPLHGKTYGREKIDNNYLASEAQGDGSIALGSRTFAKGELSVSLGSVSSAEGVASNAIGATAEAKGNMATAVGFNALANAGNALAVGSEANAGQNETVALGHGATVTVAKGNVSIGADSRDKKAQKVTEAKVRTKRGADVTYSGFAGNNAASVVSVGDAGKERQIVNVGAGAISDTSTDAINGSQLYAIAKTLKDDLDAINPTWTLKDDKGGSATINGGKDNKNGNTVTVKGDGDIAVTVDDKGMTIDGTKLTETIKKDAIKIKGGDGKALTKSLGDNVEITGKGPIKTRVAGDKLEISAETATLPANGGNGKITVNNGDDDKLVTAKNIAEAINQSGWKIKAGSENGGKVEGDNNKEELINPGDTVTLKAGKNLSVKQSGGEFTFSVIDTPSFSSVQLNGNGKNGNVTLSSEGNKLTLSDGNGAGQNGVVISGVASGLNKRNLADLKAGDAEMKNAASVADLKTAIDGVSTSMQGAGFALKDAKGQEVKQSLGQAIKVSGDSNITTTAITNGEKGLKISLNNDLTVGDKAPGSIKVNGADGKEAVSLNGQDGTIKLTSAPAA